jgi:hypothetical protein
MATCSAAGKHALVQQQAQQLHKQQVLAWAHRTHGKPCCYL